MLITKPKKSYEFIIIGAGPAGITTALKLLENGKNGILLIDAGNYKYSKKRQEISKAVANGSLSSEYYSKHSQIRFGGSSNVWTGQCAVLENDKFQNEKYWPIKYSEVYQYYEEAANILDLSKKSFLKPYQNINENIIYKPFFFSKPTRFREKFFKRLKENKNIDILQNSYLKRIIDNKKLTNEIEIITNLIDKKKIQFNNLIISCGGIENARILLSSGFQNKNIGKGFSEHPHIFSKAKIKINNNIIKDILYKRRVVHAFQFSNLFLKNNLQNSFSICLAKQSKIKGKKESEFGVAIKSEMHTSDNNKISLHNTKNKIDIHRANIVLNFNIQAARKSWELFSKEIIKSGIGRTTILPEELKIRGGGHFMGSTKMGESHNDSVVDQNCLLHGYKNIYLNGASVFSASGSSNPTYTIVALALRLGQHLSKLQ